MDTVSYSDANCTGRITHRWDYGLLYFVYGEKYSTELESFAKQTVNSAKRFKKLNPEIKIGVWTTLPGVFNTIEFDFIGEIEQRHVVHARQWLTRINYMRCSPFVLTLASTPQV